MEVFLKGLQNKYPENENINYLVTHEVELNFVLLGYISDAFQRMDEEEFFPHLMSLLESLVFFYQKYSLIDDVKDRVNLFHQDVNDIISKDLFGKKGLSDQILCTKGCSKCCSQLVTVTKSEAELLLPFTHSIDLERLKKQSAATLDTWTDVLQESEGRCVFLDQKDGSCRVWSKRPANCRNYFVIGSNEGCSVFKRDPDISRSLKSVYADICISAFYSLDGGGISLAQYMHEKLT